jgi:cytochrome c peroxidase
MRFDLKIRGCGAVRATVVAVVAVIAVLASVSHTATAQSGNAFTWNIPKWLPPPAVPADNPMSDSKVELGRRLFYDKRLSSDASIACATCHEQSRAFTDGRKVGLSFNKVHGVRNPMGLANVGYLPVLTWANPHLKSLETQALVPIFGDNPIEMGMAGQEQILFDRLRHEALYPGLFANAFPELNGELSLATVTRALAAFQRTLISANSAYDRYKYGRQDDALSPEAKRGEQLFFDHRLECYHCHAGFNFTDNMRHSRSAFSEVGFHNTGLYNIANSGAYPPAALGLSEFTGLNEDRGKFRTPSLRNVAVTGPYMHDGSIATIDEVIAHYEAGGQTIESGPYAGNGRNNPNRNPLVVGFTLTPQEKIDLIAFLESLTDEEFLRNPKFANPWRDGPNAEPANRQLKFDFTSDSGTGGAR